jgi:hypothetical protein
MEDFLEKMFASSAGTNAVNFLQQLQKRDIQFKPDRENLGWVEAAKPNTININDLYNPPNLAATPSMITNNPRMALSTALHEMFHSQDMMGGRTVGEWGAVDEAKHLLGIQMATDEKSPWTPDYSPYNESLTRLRQEDMQLPQGQSILKDPRVQKYIDKAFHLSRYNSSFFEEATKPQRKKDFTKALEMGLYPEQRWIEPREPTVKEQISDAWDKLKDVFK